MSLPPQIFAPSPHILKDYDVRLRGIKWRNVCKTFRWILSKTEMGAQRDHDL